MLNPQYFKTKVVGKVTVEDLKRHLELRMKDPDLQTIYVDPRQRIVVAGRVLKFFVEVKPKSADLTIVVGKGYWVRAGLVLVGFLLFFPLAIVYLAVSWSAASRFNRCLHGAVESFAGAASTQVHQDEYREPGVPAGGAADYLKDLERLAGLKEKGALTGEEYAAQKQRILDQLHG